MTDQSGLIIIDKQSGMTSQAVVNRVKRILGAKKAGHGGTLDPMATGVLPVMVGSAVGASDYIISHDKHYMAGIQFGLQTDTQDTTGNVTARFDNPGSVDMQILQNACEHFTGEIMQTPPMYSAIKIGGKKLVDLAREGIEIERQSRCITVYSITPSKKDGMFYIDVKCSKGTYIRTLCHDIGAFIGCGAVMSSLRRLSAGRFDISQSITLDKLESLDADGIKKALIPTSQLFDGFDVITLDAEREKLFRNGVHLGFARNGLGEPVENKKYAVYSQGGMFFAIGECVMHDGILCLKTKKFFA